MLQIFSFWRGVVQHFILNATLLISQVSLDVLYSDAFAKSVDDVEFYVEYSFLNFKCSNFWLWKSVRCCRFSYLQLGKLYTVASMEVFRLYCIVCSLATWEPSEVWVISLGGDVVRKTLVNGWGAEIVRSGHIPLPRWV